MKSTFFARRALLILCVIFFLVPFALRGSRMSLERMENNVKDWLPDSFEETKELTWFAKHFVGEQAFVLLTWEGCSEKDESFRLLVEKLENEVQPPQVKKTGKPAETSAGAEEQSTQTLADQRTKETETARELGDQLGLYTTGDYHLNWGQLEEKWLKGGNGDWYYVTPKGELFRWHGRANVLGAVSRLFQRKILGNKQVHGEHIATFGQPPTAANQNDFYSDPRKLTARVLNSVTTGPEALAKLSEPGGPMWPIGTQYSEQQRHEIARRRALDRLKGALYGPEPYEHFTWTSDDLPRVINSMTQKNLPDDWQQTADAFIGQLVHDQYKDDRAKLLQASLIDKERHWDAMFKAMGIESPGLQTCIMVTLSKPGTQDLRRVIGRGLMGKPRGKLIDLAVESGVLPPAKPPMMSFAKNAAVTGKVLRMGGPPVDNVAIDEEGQITLARLVVFSALIGLGLAYILFRNVNVTLMVFMVGGISAVTSLSIVWWTGSSVDAILMSMPSLVYVLGLSGAIHIVNYYREAVHDGGVEGAPERALKHGWLPCTLAAFTTALGLMSLYQSNIFPIRKFGLFSAIGVMATLALLFTYLPSALQLWPPGYQRDRHATADSALRHHVHEFWQRTGAWVVDHHWWVTGSLALVMLVAGLGLTKLNTSIQLLKLFDRDAKIIRDYRWLETHVGKLVPMELVVSVDQEHQYPFAEQRTNVASLSEQQRDHEKYEYDFLERIELVAHIQNSVEDVFGENGQDIVGKALSASTFSPPICDPLDSQRATINTKLEQSRHRFVEDNYLAMDDDQRELWRISVRLGALNDVDYGQFVSQLKRVVEPVLSAYDYRDRILKAIEQQKPEGDHSSPTIWNGTRIAVLGSADPRTPAFAKSGKSSSPTTKVDGGKSAEQKDTASGHSADPDDVRRVFAKVLGDLLRAKGFQGRRRGRTPKRFIAWNDPKKSPISEPRADQWGKMLGQFDCVVILRDDPGYDVDFIKEHAKAVVDARQTVFVPGKDLTAKQQGRPIEVTYTGVVPIVYKAQRTLLHSLINSIGWAFVMIAAVMMVLLRTRATRPFNVAGGLVSMLPNVFPVILIFGVMGHMNILVDIGTMMTASVAMGVAVDDTIHFLTWFRDGIRQGLGRHDAIKKAYAHVALAMTQTTIIGGLGLAVFSLSTFTPTQRFGTMMLTLLVAALVGDLVMLPALLAGPLGKFLCPKVDRKPDVPAAVSEDVEPSSSEQSPDEATTDRVPVEPTSRGSAGPMHEPPRGPAPRPSAWMRNDSSHNQRD